MTKALPEVEMPEDIRRIAADTLDNVLCHDVEAYGGSYEDARNAAISDIAKAILAERQRSQWQPIKTAPKDGTKILLGCPESLGYPGVVEKCFWWKGRKWWDWGCPDKPTHWQPLPAAPVEV